MSISDLHDEGSEYVELFLELVVRESEATRLDAEELREAGFVPVFVRGSSSVIWLQDGMFYTTDAALTEVRPVIEDEKEDI